MFVKIKNLYLNIIQHVLQWKHIKKYVIIGDKKYHNRTTLMYRSHILVMKSYQQNTGLKKKRWSGPDKNLQIYEYTNIKEDNCSEMYLRD